MNEDAGAKLRVKIEDMPPREEETTDSRLEGILKRISGREGAPCERNCDCGVGLICQERKCARDW